MCLWNGKVKSTLIFPDLTRENPPKSRTGVLPVADLCSIGPVFGRRRPYLSVFPKVTLAARSSNLSTNFSGIHFMSPSANSNVDIPNISLGRMCT